MAKVGGVFNCKDCDLTEEMINTFDQNEYMEIIDLLEEHNIDADLAENFMQAQNLLFEHLMQRENALSGGNSDADGIRINVVQRVVEEHHKRRKKLLETANSVNKFINKLPSNRKKELKRYFPNLDADIKRAIKELQNDKCSFIVAGETGSGKSCFINLLMGHTGQNFLPVSNCPSTSCLCEISYGEKGEVRAYKSGSDKPDVEPLSVENMTEKLSHFTHQKEDRDKGILYTRVEVDWPLEWLKSGLIIVDSPGVGERREITEMVKEMMPKAFGFIYVINTTKAGGIQEGELEDLLFRQSATKSVSGAASDDKEKSLSDEFDPRTAIFVFNKWDLVDRDEKQKIKDFVEMKLKKVYKGIDPASQMFFLSTQQATEALKEKQFLTKDYKNVLEGIERLMEFSLRSKMRKYYNYFADLLSRLVFILKAYLGNFKDFQRKYREVKNKLESLKNASTEVKRKMTTALTKEVESIVRQLRTHLLSDKIKEHLSKWHDRECPRNILNWNGLAREAKVKSHERVIAEIKRWETDTEILQKANERLLKIFESEFMSLKGNLSEIEGDLLGGDIDDKDLKKLFGDINHSLVNEDDLQLDKTDKIILGVTAPIWVPVGLVVGILAAPFIIGFAVREAIKENRREQAYYEGYLNGTKGTIADLMKIETESAIQQVTSGDGLKNVIESSMKELVMKMLKLMNKIPDFIKADEDLLSDLRREIEEGINQDTRSQCHNLVTDVISLQRGLDFFLLLHIHENDLEPKDLQIGDFLAEGSFGDIYKGTWNSKEGTKVVAVKRMKVSLTEYHASELRVEHSNLKKIQSENTIRYFGLCMIEEKKNKKMEKVPLMVMELCETALHKIIYDITKYTGPGTLDYQNPNRSSAMVKMANYAMQIANGLKAIHKYDFVHRDLKPANILVDVKRLPGGGEEHVLKLCDFGLTKKEDEILKTKCGTPLYMAPEVSEGFYYNKSSDMFSYGLIFVELFYGKLVCHLGFVDIILHPTTFTGDPLSLNGPPTEWKKIMAPCWSARPEDRPTAEDCYNFLKTQVEKGAK